MKEQPFSNREISAMFERIDDTLQGHTLVHNQILAQTTKTNGRVSKLESWKWTFGGGLAVILFLFPFFMYFFGSQLEQIKDDIKANTEKIQNNISR